jgi:sarcosine oxidase subunit alpha
MRRGPFRIPAGGTLDRSRTVRFKFDARPYSGFAGDTLASALLGNAVRRVARSFKYHRPRGVFSSGIEEPNALLQLHRGARSIASERATMVELKEGLEAYPQSGWPSVRWDAARVFDLTAPLWAAGFYNKAFIWPSWHVYESLVRRMAGLGRAPDGADPDYYDVRNLHCDVLVVGGGVAGISAGIAAGGAGARVLLVEQQSALGGQCAWDGAAIAGRSALSWLDTAVERLRQLPDVKVLTRTMAVGHYDHGVVSLVQRGDDGAEAPRETLYVVRTGKLILATGAIEQPLVFCNNDRPGIMLAGAAREYVRRYAVAPGRQVLVATNNNSAYATARDLKDAGVEVIGIADSRADPSAELDLDLRSLGIPVFSGFIPIDTAGFGGLRAVTIGKLSQDGLAVASRKEFACDALAVSGGWNPTLHLHSQGGGKLVYSELTGALEAAAVRSTTVGLVGSAAGINRIDEVVRHAGATAAALAATTASTGAVATGLQEPAQKTLTGAVASFGLRISPVGNTARKWVDLLHDVTVADLELAVRENFVSVEHVKRLTTAGMAADQGKTSTVLTLENIARLRGLRTADLGHTTFRPPFTPVTLGSIAAGDVGEYFAPRRHLPTHAWHAQRGAVFQDFGEWLRPVAYLRGAESRAQAATRETHAVRAAAGVFDGSPLGKIEVHGPDALEFLNKFYINDLSTLKPQRVRYVMMLRESGAIFDDGTVVMLAPDHFLVTTTSGQAARVTEWLEEWHQCEWPQLNVAIVPITDQWATFSLTGPRAREILATFETNIDLSNSAFPHSCLRVGHLAGIAARVYRVSFSGELTYEINVASTHAQTFMDALMSIGICPEIAPFGLDALLAMRLEKGFLHIGTDTDGTTVPDDVGWGAVAARKQQDFIGRRSLVLPENLRADRLQMVGLASLKDEDLQPGSHVRLPDSVEATDGWVTSAARGTLDGRPIGLAMLRAGRRRLGTELSVHDMGRVTAARVVALPFFDSTGARMNA